MRITRLLFLFALTSIATQHPAISQTVATASMNPTPIAATSPTKVPMLVRYNGVAKLADGGSSTGKTSMTFLIYKDAEGGDPLWMETQSVTVDAAGRYELYLGSSYSSGLPADLFGSGEARWLEVQVAGQQPGARVLLTSVPYALKAADAATLGGLPASAFMLAGPSAGSTSAVVAPAASSGTIVTTTGGTAGLMPVWTGSSTIGNSIVYLTSTGVGIGRFPNAALDIGGTSTFRGSMGISRAGDATTSAGAKSFPILIQSSVYNTTQGKNVLPYFQIQTEPTANNTASAGATLNFLYYSGVGAAPSETGLAINGDGTIHFSPNQVFPSTSSTGTALSGTSGSSTGVQGTSTSATGVAGTSTTGNGMLGYTAGGTLNTAGVLGGAGGPSGFGGIAGVWGDAYSHVGVLGTSHSYAGVQGISSIGQGVQGQSTSNFGVQGSSTSGTGVQGASSSSYGVEGTSTSGPGVLGYTGGGTLNTGGVIGQAGGTSGFTGIAGVWGDASAHVGVFGSSSQYAGVIGSSTNGPGIQGTSTNSWAGQFSNSSTAASVYATNSSSSGGLALYGLSQGNSGIGVYASATASGGTGVEAFGNANGVSGNTAGGVLNTAGVLGIAGSRTGVSGIAGVWGDAQEHVGVIGSSADFDGVYGASTTSYGIQGFSAATNENKNAAGVYGVAGGSANPDFNGIPIGVWADITGSSTGYALLATSNGSTAGYLTNNGPAPTLYLHNFGSGSSESDAVGIFHTLEASTPDGTCGFGGNGDMTCTGQVKTLATTGGGSRTVETYSMQSPENWMEDFGSGTVQNGVATVSIDAAFAETITANTDYHVFLTPNGDSKGLYISSKSATQFEVRESGGGTSSLSFDYRIVAKRRGLEKQRMVDVTEGMRVVKARNALRQEKMTQKEKE